MSEPITHDRAFEMLPWLVNGSLAAEERELVEQHVRACLSCHRELKQQQRLRAALRTQPAVHISAQGGFEKLTRALGTPDLPAARGRPLPAFARFAVVGVAGAALLGALLWLASVPRDGRYAPTFETLATSPAGGSAAVDVIFAQSVTAAEIQQLLIEIDGSIAAGPSDLGRYTVRLEPDAGAGAGNANVDVDALLARLQADPRIRFAGRSLAAGRAP